jgi:hypothetical protein
MTIIVATNILFWAAGFTPCQSFILIQKQHINNNALIQHELTHVKQMQDIGAVKWWLRYIFNKSFRQDAEIEAYKVQIKYGISISQAATYLSTMYHLDITYSDAVKLLVD